MDRAELGIDGNCGMRISVTGPLPTDPAKRVKSIEAIAVEVSRAAGEDEADAAMALLTAACHLAIKMTPHMTAAGRTMFLAERLGNAYAAAEAFFTLATADEAPSSPDASPA
jgi:hypothetical protein